MWLMAKQKAKKSVFFAIFEKCVHFISPDQLFLYNGFLKVFIPTQISSSPVKLQINTTKTMSQQLEIQAYLKPHCGWSMGVRAIMEKYSLEYKDLDIINNPDIYAEMVEKSGQNLSPSVEVNGVMLADVSGEEVENYLISNNLVEVSSIKPSVPIDEPCSDEEHKKMIENSKGVSPVRFF